MYNYKYAKSLLEQGQKLHYNSLSINGEPSKRVWVKVKNEMVGVTALFGKDNRDKVFQKRWYPNGLNDVMDFLISGNVIDKETTP